MSVKPHLFFEKQPREEGLKTDRWQVWTIGKDNDERGPLNAELGNVHWWVYWRRYVFFPDEGTFYDPGCLREIADFCERETKKRRTP